MAITKYIRAVGFCWRVHHRLSPEDSLSDTANSQIIISDTSCLILLNKISNTHFGISATLIEYVREQAKGES